MLKKLCLLLLLTSLLASLASAQFVKEYRVSENQAIERVNLTFSSYKSQTQLKRNPSRDPIYLHAHLLHANILPDFRSEISKKTLSASLVHKNIESDNLGKSITTKLFSSGAGVDHTWDIGLATNYAYDLGFNLGMGTADFDLSQLAISTFKIKSASADVHLHYKNNSPNLVVMDTLLVTLNMGTVEMDQANLAQAKKIIIEVNYGQISLTYGAGLPAKGQVIAAVVGGSVYLKLPPATYPVKIRMKTTPLCRTSLPDYLLALDDDTYITKGYSPTDPKLLEFILDVSVGAITVE